MADWNITPVSTLANNDALHIEVSGEFTLTEAMNLALRIMHSTQDYGKVTVTPK